uniref:hypothetical protein n=1 Tax=Methanocorpusculum sp. GPch4 TaxID=2527877 RepID=UPI001432CB6F
PSPGVESSPAVGFGPKDQIEAGLPILKDMGVDVAPVQTLFQQSSAAGRTGNLESQRALEKQALQAAARLMDQSFTAQMAPLKKKATQARIQQAAAQAEQAKVKAEEGRLTDAVQVYRQALQTLKGD